MPFDSMDSFDSISGKLPVAIDTAVDFQFEVSAAG